MKKVICGKVACDTCTKICCAISGGYQTGECAVADHGNNYCCSSVNTYWCSVA